MLLGGGSSKELYRVDTVLRQESGTFSKFLIYFVAGESEEVCVLYRSTQEREK